jgi:hypothetical protein
MKKLLIIPFFFFSLSVFGQFTKPELYNGINLNIRNKGASQKRLADMLDSIVVSMGSGGGSSLTLVDGNGTTVNGTGDGVDLGGTTSGDIDITGNYGFKVTQYSGSEYAKIDLSSGNNIDLNYFNSSVTGTDTYDALLRFGTDIFQRWSRSPGPGMYSILGRGYGTDSGLDGFHIYGKTSGYYPSESDIKFRVEASGRTTLNLGSDATGDTYYRNSSGYLTRLAAGTNGYVLTLASGIPSWAAPSGGSGLTVGTSTITSGTNTRVLYNNSGVLGEYTVSGSGNVAMTTSPVFTTPNIGTATGTASGNYSLASGGTATGTNTFAMGSNPFILTSGVTTGTGATAGIQNVFNSLTTGNGLDISTSSLTSGKGLALTSTSTAINHTWGTNALFSSRISGANANSTRTAIAGEFVATNTGTGSTNTAVYAAASGGTNNYSIYASGQMYVEGIASSGYIAWFKASGVSRGIYINSTGVGVMPIVNNTTDFGNSSQQFKDAYFYGNVVAGGITTILARIHSRGAGTTTGYNLLTENSGATQRFGVRDNGAIEFSGSAGTSGYLLQSNGATSPPTWVAPTNTNVQANVTNYKYSLVGFPSGTSGSLGTPVTSAQLANGESVTIVVHWSAMDGDSNTGAGGTFITTWTKSGGTLNKVMDLNTGLTGSDTGDALAVSSSDSGGDILISLGTGTIAGNMKASGIAEVTINK